MSQAITLEFCIFYAIYVLRAVVIIFPIFVIVELRHQKAK